MPIAKRLAVELPLPVLTTYVCSYRGSNPDLPHARQTSTNATALHVGK